MSLYDSLSRLMGGSSVASPTGSNIAGYSGMDLSGFTPGASAPVIPNAAVPAGAGGNDLLGGIFGSMFDKTDSNGLKTQGWGGMALSGLQGLGSSYMAMKQYGLAEDALKEQKRQFDTNFDAQRKLTNSQLSDRQRARVASNEGAYQSVGTYMKEYGV